MDRTLHKMFLHSAVQYVVDIVASLHSDVLDLAQVILVKSRVHLDEGKMFRLGQDGDDELRTA